MISEDGEWLLCDGEGGCSEKVKNHAWGQIKSDWAFLKDGRAYCPDHYPDWYTNWTRRKR